MSAAASRLRSVLSAQLSAPLKAVLVVIPGIGELGPEQWKAPGTHDSWLRSPDLQSEGKIAVFTFAYDSSSLDLSPDRIYLEGARLLAELDHISNHESCPLVLICHSSGGFILKKALSIAYLQQKSVQAYIAATVLISAPHTKDEGSAALERILSLMIKTTWRQKSFRIPPELPRDLIEDCRNFELALLDAPLATLFEEVETRTSFMSKVSIVDEDRARTNLEHEIRFGVGQDHHLSCCISPEIQAELFPFLHASIAAWDKKHRRDEVTSLEHSIEINERGREVGSQSDRSINAGHRNFDLVVDAVAPPSEYYQSTRPFSRSSQPQMHRQSREVSISATRSLIVQRLVPDFTELRVHESRLPFFNVPYERNEFFYGRGTMLAKLTSVLCAPALTPEAAKGMSFALSGPGGIGKTQVAAEWAHRHRSDFEAIFWVPAHDVEKLHQTLREIAISLGLVAPNSAESFDRSWTRNAVLSWLECPLKSHGEDDEQEDDKATWLIVFDSVDDLDILQDFWPRSASGRTLITTRDPFAASGFSYCRAGQTLAEFDRQETVEFLIHLTSRDKDEEDGRLASDFAARLGGIPLAIVTMAGLIIRRDITFAEFLRKYEDPHSHTELFQTRMDFFHANGYAQTIASAYRFEDLVHGGDLLDVLCFFDPDLIAEHIFTDNDVQTDMSTSFPLPEDKFDLARTELIKSSLVTRNRNNKTLTIHRLTQDARRSNMSPARYSTVFTSALQLLAKAWPYGVEFGFLGYETYKWERGNELYTHILFLQKLAANVEPPSSFTEAHLEPSKVLLEAAWFSIMRADYADTKFLVEMADMMLKPLELDIEGRNAQSVEVRKQFEEQKRLFHFHRGCRALHTNEPTESLSHLQTFRSMLRDEVGEEPHSDDQRMGVCLNELGNAYFQNDDKDNAEACFRKSVKFLEVVDGVQPNTVSMPLINLGFVLWQKDELAEAADAFEMALEYRKARYGPDDIVSFALGKLYLGYGNVKKDQGDLDASFDLHKKCLLQYTESLGPFHHRMGDGSVRLSDHYVRMERYQDAKLLLDQACRIYGNRAHFRPERARATYKLSEVLQLLGQSEDAEIEAQKAFDLFRLVHPDDERRPEQLNILDYDKPIMFWSK